MEDKLELEGILASGYGIVAKYVMMDKYLSVGAKAVYSYLCSYAGKGDTAFPSRNKMCYDLNISNNTLGRYLKEIRERNYVSISQENKNGKFLNNVYKINYQVPLTNFVYTQITDTQKTVYGKVNTINNISKNNIDINNNINNKKEYKEKRFIKPTLEEVKSYCLERNNSVDAERFIDYYESVGWKVGKNSMKDWKASVRTWERNSKPKEEKTLVRDEIGGFQG